MKNCSRRRMTHSSRTGSSRRYTFHHFALVLFVLVFAPAMLLAQQRISGRIMAGDTAIAGATIQVKGGTAATQSDAAGYFTISAPAAGTLIISSVGYNRQEIPVSNRSMITVNLQSAVKEIEQVVVIGYGTQKKSDLTGSISSVTDKDLKNLAVTNVQTAIVGKIPGVYAATTSGQPGSGAMIRIRGIGTVNENSPLYVVDGQFLDNIINLNPNDIERLDVLKDASATAIYGSRGANGVIVISTKKGINGPPVVSFDGYVGGSTSTFTPHVSNNTELYNFLKESYANDNLAFPAGITQLYNRGVNTNWWDECTRTGLTQNYNLSIRAGSDRLKTALSAGYVQEDGFIKNTFYKRFTARGNMEYTISDHVTLGANVSMAQSNQRIMDMFSEPVWQIISADPFSYVYNPLVDQSDPNYAYNKYAPTEWAYTDNPLFLLESNNAYRKQFETYGNAYLNIKLIKGLSYNAQFSFDRPTATGGVFYPTFNAKPSPLNMGRLKFRSSNQVNYAATSAWNTIWQQTLNFKRTFGQHDLTVLAGMTYENNHYEDVSGSKTNTPGNDPAYWVINAGTASPIVSGSISENSLVSYLGRINYSYGDRYLATASFRADGSSRFAPGNRWGYFPSFSLGWRLSNESFFSSLKNGVLSDLKIRAGWGQTGNQSIDNTAAITTIATAPYQVYTFGTTNYPAYGPRNIGNAGIQWETSEQTNVGVDAAFLNNRLSLTVDYYVKNTDNMLLRLPVPAYTGYANAPYVNAGSVQNKGFDLAIGWQEHRGDFTYNISANASAYKNVVTSLGEGDNPIYGTGFKSGLTKTEVGGPIGQFFGYKWLGIFQSQDEINAYKGKDGALLQPLAKPGDFKFANVNGDNVLNDDDRTYIGNPHPDLIYGLSFNVGYKGFDLSSVFSGTLGNDMWNENLAKYFVSIDNVPEDAYTKAWRKQGDNTRFPRITQTNANNNNRSSSWYVEDGSYVRLKNVQLGYTFAQKILGKSKLFSSCRVYVSGQNLFTITNYTGMDPEVGNSVPTKLGFEITRYPASRILTFGVNAQF